MVELVAGSNLPGFDVELGYELCTGFITPEPTFDFTCAGDGSTLGPMFEADEDTTLIVRSPNGA